eukprot:CAMPEP_0183324982 /NCGR_PEP_ID=MMETSP0160_2-20130417/78508_1 /TAXON_ID=2839 ORGANISM="Odontella Sinensis, Strain Grunow 1884" /NCGR_SAMPLE_ID=MMETSP0160_2 /ASSEMBLY_ACC=CAM_ASM_000250 /LENGTH=58 /DNA_ID=CAMNT_0025492689 /DNA_START=286 /DNA_END=458 /DNA_ORIENTATION=+
MGDLMARGQADGQRPTQYPMTIFPSYSELMAWTATRTRTTTPATLPGNPYSGVHATTS